MFINWICYTKTWLTSLLEIFKTNVQNWFLSTKWPLNLCSAPAISRFVYLRGFYLSIYLLLQLYPDVYTWEDSHCWADVYPVQIPNNIQILDSDLVWWMQLILITWIYHTGRKLVLDHAIKFADNKKKIVYILDPDLFLYTRNL